MRVGILEDDPAVCGLLHETLERFGHAACIYRDGWDFLAQFLTEELTPPPRPFDAVLIDLILPGAVTGLEALQQIRMTYPDLPIVVISAVPYLNLEVIKDAYPGVKTLQKPFKLRDLLTAIQP